MKLWCTNFLDFKRIAYKNKWDEKVPDNVAIISINNSAGTVEEYHICKDSENVLNLNFDDADPMSLKLDDDIETYTYETGTTIEFFTKDMANRSVKFIENIIDKHRDVDFYIHCSAGISRSQAFVKFIKNIYHFMNWETNTNNPCLHPNGFVFQKLMQAYRNR